MNRLWVRLSFLFSVVVLISFATVMLIVYSLVQAAWPEAPFFNSSQVRDKLVNELSAYYQTHESWDGIDVFLSSVEAGFSLSIPRHLLLRLTDVDGHIIYGEPLDSQANLLDTRLITVRDKTVGRLNISVAQSGDNVASPLDFETIIFLIAFVGSTIGILSGILTSRSVTAPVEHLAEAAKAIGARNLESQVEVKGTTEIMELAQAFNDMVAALNQNEMLRRNMVADVAHELRTPLTALQGNIYAILDDTYPMTKAEIAGLYEQTRLLSRLLKDLHELSLAEARQLPLDLKPIDLSEMLQELLLLFGPVTESKNISFVVDIPRALPPTLVDQQRINQVLHNLLSNALRHTPEDGTINLTARSIENCLEITVKDTGQGIAHEHLVNVFERFYRTDSARSRHTGGSGLGLAIAKAIIEAHHGQIYATSEGIPGKGSTFVIRLPFYLPEPRKSEEP